MTDAAPSPALKTPNVPPTRPLVLFEDGREGGRALLFEEPRELILAKAPGEVAAAFAHMEAATKAGAFLAGYASYELGYALEPKFASQATPSSPTPLLAFGVFDAPQCLPAEARRAPPSSASR